MKRPHGLGLYSYLLRKLRGSWYTYQNTTFHDYYFQVTMFLTMIQCINAIIPLSLALCLGIGILSFQFLLILHFCRRIDPERERLYDMKWMGVKEL